MEVEERVIMKLLILNFICFQPKTKKVETRPFFTNLLNNSLKKIPEFKEHDITFTCHSFRYGFIKSLWDAKADLKEIQQQGSTLRVYPRSACRA